MTTSWVKISVDMFNDQKLKIIDRDIDNNLIHYIWIRAILIAGKCNKDGKLYINDNIKYTLKTLAIEFNRTVKEVRKAFNILIKLEMIEITSEKEYMVKNWSIHQNSIALEKIRKQTRERVAKYRERKKEEKLNEDLNMDADNYDIDEDMSKDLNSKINDNEDFKEETNQSNESHNNQKESNSEKPKANGNSKLINSQTIDNNLNDINENESNVLCNGDSNVNKINVTHKKKRENKKENKIKNKIKERENKKELDNTSLSPMDLMIYCEKITGRVGSFDIGALTLAVNCHNGENVKHAIDKAIEVGKVNMPYINGILQNWKREGYPKNSNGEGGICDRRIGEFNKKASDKFKLIEPKKCRELGDDERRKATEILI